jgi:hypothetical protein
VNKAVNSPYNLRVDRIPYRLVDVGCNGLFCSRNGLVDNRRVFGRQRQQAGARLLEGVVGGVRLGAVDVRKTNMSKNV